MEREELIAMAREAGLLYWTCGGGDTAIVPWLDQLTTFASLVAAREREECARVCEWLDGNHFGRCAAAIRARATLPKDG